MTKKSSQKSKKLQNSTKRKTITKNITKNILIVTAFIGLVLVAKVTSMINGGKQSLVSVQYESEKSESQLLPKYPNLESAYKKPSDEELQKYLTPIQYHVTQEDGTEQAFNNEYHDFKGEGIYVDVVSGEALFSSLDKYDSRTGWPSFTKPLVDENIVKKIDYKLGFPRTEIRSRHADSHLGHLFNDGPQESGGLRYCMNSAALEFIPVNELENRGYGEFSQLFK